MSIHINVPSTKCSAGAIVSGTVSLHGDVNIDVKLITIRLVGRCKSKVARKDGDSTSTYRGRAPLLEYRQVLFQGPNTMRTNGHSWPFSFTFPSHCVARGADSFKQRYGLFDLNPQQCLPPSFASEHRSSKWKGECFVRYELEASLIGTKIFSLGDLKSEKTLNFTTTRDIETFKPEFIEKGQRIACYSLRLQPGREDGPLTFKEKLQSAFKEKLQSNLAVFHLHMLLPKVGILARPLPLVLKMDHDAEASTTQSSPIITLRKCTVMLQAITYIQCIRDEHLRQGDQQEDWSDDLHVASVDYSANMDKAPPVTESIDLQKLMRIKVPWFYTPTFSTFNIRRTYRFVYSWLLLSVQDRGLKSRV